MVAIYKIFAGKYDTTVSSWFSCLLGIVVECAAARLSANPGRGTKLGKARML